MTVCGKRELTLGRGQGHRGQASISGPGMRQEDHLGQMSPALRQALAACVSPLPSSASYGDSILVRFMNQQLQ